MNDIPFCLGGIGDKRAGKGAAAAHLIKAHAALHERFSTRIRELARRHRIPPTRENLQRLAMDLKEIFLEDVLARPIVRAAQLAGGRGVFVEGIRYEEDSTILRGVFPRFKLIYVTASPRIRYERMLADPENEGDRDLTFEQFLAQEQAGTEINIPRLGALADYKIVNEGTKEMLHARIDEIVAEQEAVAYG